MCRHGFRPDGVAGAEFATLLPQAITAAGRLVSDLRHGGSDLQPMKTAYRKYGRISEPGIEKTDQMHYLVKKGFISFDGSLSSGGKRYILTRAGEEYVKKH